MDEQQIQKLVEAGVAKALAGSSIKALEARALRGDAMVAANRVLGGLALHESAKARVVEIVTREGAIPVKDGAIDSEKFEALVTTEAQREAAYIAGITGVGTVIGMGPSGKAADPEKIREAEKRERKANKRLREAEQDVFSQLMGNPKAAEFAVSKGEAA